MQPNHSTIEALAYGLWQARGCPDGSPDIDWQAAERQIHSAAPDEAKPSQPEDPAFSEHTLAPSAKPSRTERAIDP